MSFRRVLASLGVLLISGCSEPSPVSQPSATPFGTPSASTVPTVEIAELLSTRPVVRPSGGESFVNPALVVREAGRLHMLTNSFTGYPGASFVSHLTSDNGIRWRPVAGGPVLRNSQVPTAIESFTTAFVTAGYRDDAGDWVAYGYTFEGTYNEGFIWRATAPALDGPWHVDQRPALESGADGAWDSLRVAEPSVVQTGDGLVMLYTGFDEEGVAGIGMATSADGRSWTKHDGPVFAGAQPWDEGSVGNPQVVATADGLVMTYRTEAGRFGFGVARSVDGATWEPSKANPIMTDDRSPTGAPIWQSEAAVIDGELRWWLEVGYGSGTTNLYAYRLDLAAAW